MTEIISSNFSLFKSNKINTFLLESITVAKNLDLGKYKKLVYDEDIFSIAQYNILKKSEECFFESHKEYIDIHIIVKGQEEIEIIDIIDINNCYENSIENDYYLYIKKIGIVPKKVQLNNKTMAILFFEDVHKTGISIGTKESSVLKVVIKIKKNKFYKEFIHA